MSTPWTPFASQMPPSHSGFLLVTNNVEARDAFGHHSHIWLVSMVHVHKEAVRIGGRDYAEKGEITAFAESGDHHIRNLTHWRFAIPEEAECESSDAPFETAALDWTGADSLEDLDPETDCLALRSIADAIDGDAKALTEEIERLKEQNNLLRQGQSGDLLDLGAELEREQIRRELKTAVRTLYQVHDAVIESDIETVIDRIVSEVGT